MCIALAIDPAPPAAPSLPVPLHARRSRLQIPHPASTPRRNQSRAKGRSARLQPMIITLRSARGRAECLICARSGRESIIGWVDQNGGSARVLPDPCLSLRVVRPVVGAEADLSASCATGLLEATTAGPGRGCGQGSAGVPVALMTGRGGIRAADVPPARAGGTSAQAGRRLVPGAGWPSPGSPHRTNPAANAGG